MTTRMKSLTMLAGATCLGAAGCDEPGKTTDSKGREAINWSKVDGAGYNRPAPVGRGNDEMLRDSRDKSENGGQSLGPDKDTSGAEPKSQKVPGKQDGGPH